MCCPATHAASAVEEEEEVSAAGGAPPAAAGRSADPVGRTGEKSKRKMNSAAGIGAKSLVLLLLLLQLLVQLLLQYCRTCCCSCCHSRGTEFPCRFTQGEK